MSQNKLTVYSNGTTRIERFVTVEGRTTVTIPVRKAYVGDVLATLGVYGKVRQVEPPSYNNDATKNALKLDSKNVYFDLATKLSGADLKVKAGSKEITGKLAGVHQVETINLGVVTKNIEFVVVTKEGTILTFNQGSTASVEFTQPEVQRMIQNALSKNFETVRPDSVLVQLVLEPVEGTKTEALLDYTTPTAAWQSVYKLRLGEKTTLEYNAKLDNPTDEDWLNSKVCVIVGDPITLDSTLGEVKVPSRSKVDLVGDKAAGPIRAQEAMRQSRSMSKGIQLQSMRAACAPAGGGFEGTLESVDANEYVGDVNYCSLGFGGGAAEVSQATAEEVGDFAKFTSQDVIDVRANLSGVVRLFTEEVEAKEVLFFDLRQDADRAYRGVRLTNTTKSSLGQGICTYYLNDTFAGQAEFPGCKPGKAKTLVFSRENGVEVVAKPSGVKPSRIAVGMASGELWWQDRQSSETPYHFDNLHKESAFEVEVNHAFSQNDPSFDITALSTGLGRESIKTEKTKTGLKLTFNLAADETIHFTVNETKIVKSGWRLEGVNGVARLTQFFVQGDEVYAKKLQASSGYKELQNLATEYAAKQQAVSDLGDEAENLKEEQSRLLELVKAGSTASQLSKWQGNLDKTEDRITEIEKKLIPASQKELSDLDTQASEALKAFAFSWAEGDESKSAFAKSKK